MPGGGSQTSTQVTGPPKYVKPYIIGDAKKGITGLLPEAQRLYQQGGAQYYPGDTVADFSPEQLAGMTGTANRAMAGSPLAAQAGGYTSDVLSGKYLNNFTGSLADDRLYNSIQARVRPGVDAQFGMAGRSDSPAHARAIAEGLTNAYAPVAAGLYGQERQYQQAAVPMAYQGAANDYVDLNALTGVGAMRQQQQQQEMGGDISRYMYNANLPQQNLSQYAQYIYGAPGSTTTSSQPGPSPLQTILGGGLGLASLFI